MRMHSDSRELRDLQLSFPLLYEAIYDMWKAWGYGYGSRPIRRRIRSQLENSFSLDFSLQRLFSIVKDYNYRTTRFPTIEFAQQAVIAGTEMLRVTQELHDDFQPIVEEEVRRTLGLSRKKETA